MANEPSEYLERLTEGGPVVIYRTIKEVQPETVIVVDFANGNVYAVMPNPTKALLQEPGAAWEPTKT